MQNSQKKMQAVKFKQQKQEENAKLKPTTYQDPTRPPAANTGNTQR